MPLCAHSLAKVRERTRASRDRRAWREAIPARIEAESHATGNWRLRSRANAGCECDTRGTDPASADALGAKTPVTLLIARLGITLRIHGDVQAVRLFAHLSY
jgi:hypothetical protein